MIGTGAAILGAGLLGAGASIWGSQSASRTQREAAERAAATQQRGQDQALGLQREALDTQRGVLANQQTNYGEAQRNFDRSRGDFEATRGNLQPWINSGQGANNLLSSFYGLGADPALGQGALARFYESPDFQFALKGGVGALDNSASAKGSLLSGNQLRAVSEYGQGLATQNLGNYLQRIMGVSQQGMGAAGQLGQFGAQQGALGMQLGQLGTNLGTGVSSSIGATTGNAASNLLTSSNNIGQSQMAAGTAEASGALGTVRGINAGLNSLSLYNQMGRTSYGGGSLGSYNGNQIGGLY